MIKWICQTQRFRKSAEKFVMNMSEPRAFNRTALISIFALTLAAGTACRWGGMYVVKNLPAGAGRSIVILTHDDYEISRGIYYQVKIGEEMVVSTCWICTAAKDPNSLNYKIVSALDGNLVAVYEETNPEKILALHDFSTGRSWPQCAPDEWTRDANNRGETLLEQLQQEYPNSNFRLNDGACGIKIPDA
jgi:hypothetical protein